MNSFHYEIKNLISPGKKNLEWKFFEKINKNIYYITKENIVKKEKSRLELIYTTSFYDDNDKVHRNVMIGFDDKKNAKMFRDDLRKKYQSSDIVVDEVEYLFMRDYSDLLNTPLVVLFNEHDSDILSASYHRPIDYSISKYNLYEF